MLLGEQQVGKMMEKPEEEAAFIEQNIGIFLGIMAAAASNKIDLIQLIINIRQQWQTDESISIKSTTS